MRFRAPLAIAFASTLSLGVSPCDPEVDVGRMIAGDAAPPGADAGMVTADSGSTTACVPATCDDGDPCTLDACGSAGCTHAADPACDPGTICPGAPDVPIGVPVDATFDVEAWGAASGYQICGDSDVYTLTLAEPSNVRIDYEVFGPCSDADCVFRLEFVTRLLRSCGDIDSLVVPDVRAGDPETEGNRFIGTHPSACRYWEWGPWGGGAPYATEEFLALPAGAYTLDFQASPSYGEPGSDVPVEYRFTVTTF